MDQKQAALKREIENGEKMDFTPDQEPWTTLTLSDGAVLKVRMIVTGITRISDEPLSGNAQYAVAHQAVVRTIKEPEHFKEAVPYMNMDTKQLEVRK
jgi:hypothetical protein